MAWLRLPDEAATNATVLAVLEDPAADERSPLEVFGYVVLLATISAGQWQDYAVTMGQAIQFAGTRARADLLLGMAQRAGYGELQEDTETGRRRFVILDDPNFIHMIKLAEKDWRAQQKADTSNPALVVQVRRRDGDACRYCGNTVNFGDRKGGWGGTYDHRPPGRPAAGPDDLVVACRTCNGLRGQISQGLDPAEGLAAADAMHPLRPVPPRLYFKSSTIPWFETHRPILNEYGLTVPEASEKDLRAGTPAPGVAEAPRAAAPSTSSQTGADTAASVATERDLQHGRWAPLSAAGSTGSAPDVGAAPGAPYGQQQPPGGQRGHHPDGPDRSEQIPADRGLPDLDTPGRDGTGTGGVRGGSGRARDGTGRAGPDSGRGGSQQAAYGQGQGSRRGRRRRGGRGRRGSGRGQEA